MKEDNHHEAEAGPSHKATNNISLAITSPVIRPRLLYSSVFVWISLTGGRFLAPMLEYAGLSDTEIGTCLALQTIVQAICSASFGAHADRLEKQHPGNGRARILCFGVCLGTTVFLLQFILPAIILSKKNGDPLGGAKENVVLQIALRCLYAVCSSMVFPVLDGLTLDYLSKYGAGKADYGKERLYGAIWWAIANLIMGPSLDAFGFPILFPFSVVALAAVLLTVVIYVNSQKQSTMFVGNEFKALPTADPEDEKEEAGNESDDKQSGDGKSDSNDIATSPSVFKVLPIMCSSPLSAAFLLALFGLSMGMAVVEGLIFLYFEVLGGTSTLCALTVLLTVLFEIPIFHMAPQLLKKHGTTRLLSMACFCYMTRVVGYSLVPDGQPFWVLMFEPLHGVTYACASMSAVEFVSQLMPPGCDATGQGILYALRGFGSILGLLFGGIGEEVLGPRIMYRVLATIVAVGFGMLQLVAMKYPAPASSRNDDDDVPLTDKSDETTDTVSSLEDGLSSEMEMVSPVEAEDTI